MEGRFFVFSCLLVVLVGTTMTMAATKVRRSPTVGDRLEEIATETQQLAHSSSHLVQEAYDGSKQTVVDTLSAGIDNLGQMADSAMHTSPHDVVTGITGALHQGVHNVDNWAQDNQSQPRE